MRLPLLLALVPSIALAQGRLDIAQMRAPGIQTAAGTVQLNDAPRGIPIVTNKLYRETYRPQFHFTARKNWLNDPNGLMFFDGTYHMFFQHNPESTQWGNMTWGHAISNDLLHWEQLDHAILPDELGTVFSGSGVVDWHNTTGFGTEENPALICIYTSAGGTSPESQGQPFTQSIAYSTDAGMTFTKYTGNPVLGHIVGENRDPKVVWHGPTRRWVMALYLDGHDYALFGSPNLFEWERLCDVALPGASECPDFVELPVDGDLANTRWLFWGANGKYVLGSFDGMTFTPETEVLDSEWGANCYAAQTFFTAEPEEPRCIQIAWMNGGVYPDMPFNQQMSFPRELTLRTTPEGIRLFREPIDDVEFLWRYALEMEDPRFESAAAEVAGLDSELWHIRAEFELRGATSVGFEVRGERITYSAEDQTLSCLGRSAPLAPIDGRVQMVILVDRTSIEVFGNNGRVSLSSCFLADPTNTGMEVFAEGGEPAVPYLTVGLLDSIW